MSQVMTPTRPSSRSEPAGARCSCGKTEPHLHSHGPKIIKWMERALVYGPGPLIGQPYRLEPFQKSFVTRLYRFDPATGQRIVRRALLGLGKGNAKTETVAALALAELAGPLAVTSPDIPVAAASYEQAGLLFNTARVMGEEGPLKPFLEFYETEIKVRDGRGSLYRVAAMAGTNDGSRPTCFICDELHEWSGRKERVHLVIGNSLNKQANGLEINITTAGFDRDSLLGRLCDYGEKVAAGEIEDPTFLYEWHAASDALDLDDPDQLIEAIKQANPAAGVFWPIENLIRRYHDPTVPAFEFRRYHLNQWTSSDDSWLAAGTWGALADGTAKLTAGQEVVLGLDGSYNSDTTALVAVTVAPRPLVAVLGCWQRPDQAGEDWHVDVLAVEQAVRDACTTLKVREIACDPYRWQRSMAVLEAEGLPVVEFAQNASRMSPATVRFIEAVANGALVHDGDTRLARHIANGVLKNDNRGVRLTKVSPKSDRKIDLAVAAVMAFDRAAFYATKPKAKAQVLSLADF